MSRVALRVITIVYAITLGYAYFASHPPEWLRRVTLSAERSGTVRFLGHRIHLSVVIHPSGPDWRSMDAGLSVPWDDLPPAFPGCAPGDPDAPFAWPDASNQLGGESPKGVSK